jgi:predicted TIM-barrel fold metal-dependent hydrolase
MERMDEEYERRGQRWCKLQKMPSEYIRSGNIYVTCEIEERLLPVVVEQIGADALLFASDYPHERNHDEYFHDLPYILGREDLTEETKRKILCDNPIRAYNLQSIAEHELAAAR